MKNELVPISGPEIVETTVGLFGGSSPAETVAKATAVADALAHVIESKGLFSMIPPGPKGKKYVRVEGWTLLGSMLGVFPVCTWTKKLEDGWEARVEARTLSGQLVGAAEASCLRSEANWRSRDEYALRSMAQTRATSKALRLPLGFVVVLAGYEATPAEEMVDTTKKIAQGGSQEPTGPSVEETQLRKSLGETPEPVRLEGTVAPGHCTLKGCGGEVELYISESKDFPGREYWGCSVAHAEKARLMDEGMSNKDANIAMSGHYRNWTGPWKKPPPTVEEVESIFDPVKIEKQVALKLAKEKV